MMEEAEIKFEEELKYFGRDVETAVQMLYANLTVHTSAADTPALNHELNKTPLFWRTTLHALQCSFFITLARVFDTTAPHNLRHLLNYAQEHKSIFTREALLARKPGDHDDLRAMLRMVGNDYLYRLFTPPHVLSSTETGPQKEAPVMAIK